MSEQDTGTSWVDRVRRWLWLDGPQRTDNSEAYRGFYLNRKPVGWRFLLVVTALGIAIGLVLLNVRDAEARADIVPDRSGTMVAVTVWTGKTVA